MNRAERRAIKFGNVFSMRRGFYQPDDMFVGIAADLDAAWAEYCAVSSNCNLDFIWIETNSIPFPEGYFL